MFPPPNTIIVADYTDAQCQYLKYYNNLLTALVDAPHNYTIINYTEQVVTPANSHITTKNLKVTEPTLASSLILDDIEGLPIGRVDYDGSKATTFLCGVQGLTLDEITLINAKQNTWYTFLVKINDEGGSGYILNVDGFTKKYAGGVDPVVSATTGEIDIYQVIVLLDTAYIIFHKGMAV